MIAVRRPLLCGWRACVSARVRARGADNLPVVVVDAATPSVSLPSYLYGNITTSSPTESASSDWQQEWNLEE